MHFSFQPHKDLSVITVGPLRQARSMDSPTLLLKTSRNLIFFSDEFSLGQKKPLANQSEFGGCFLISSNKISLSQIPKQAIRNYF